MARHTREHTYENDDGEECTITVPQEWQICHECHGEGKHSHAIDGNGITSSEWEEWDYEEQETYMSGGYDRTCEVCHGEGKVLEDNLDAMNAADRAILEQYYRDEADYQNLCRMERMMGA